MIGCAKEQQLLRKIETKRRELVLTANMKGFTSEETVTRSKELDKLLNQYYLINLRINCHTV
ncbi:Spo0E family sporulation regulatory protein-aspartic acid phosphatase [Anaerobacillus sp. MEB173]|uniref:Spo0E family sporulation regulatory protein-aspartic acid phosphatase n=1 Tax=Anaerobacillus sp. MEB173 TaxID=3383345 RepID=UPI003F8E5A01